MAKDGDTVAAWSLQCTSIGQAHWVFPEGRVEIQESFNYIFCFLLIMSMILFPFSIFISFSIPDFFYPFLCLFVMTLMNAY